MEFTEREDIEKFLDISILSKGEAFIKSSPANVAITLKERHLDSLLIQLRKESSSPPAKMASKGTISFRSYNMSFEFLYLISKRIDENSALITFPKSLVYADKRKCARIMFDSRENKILRLWCERTKIRFNAMIYNLCMDGIGFFVLDQDVSIKADDLVYIDDIILGQKATTFIKICHTQNNTCGGYFLDAPDSFKISLRKAIYTEILWRSEQHLSLLRDKSEVVDRIQSVKEEREAKKDGVLDYLDLINPFLESAITVLDQFLNLPVKKEELEFKTITSGRYDATTYINCSADTFQFQFFLCLEEAVLLKITERLTGNLPTALDSSSRDLLGELGNMIVGNAKKDLADSLRYTLSTPGLIIGKHHVLSTLSRFPAIRISFSSDLGPLDVVLFVSDIIKKTKQYSQIDLTTNPHDAMNYIEPIYNSTVNLFANYLDIAIKEKSINVRNPLTPKFEVTAFLSFDSDQLEGQVVINLTEKLARFIYKCLIHEEVAELNDEVRDAVGEILNMITGNAKEEFCQSGLHYQMSTPFVVIGRDQFIQTIGEIPFVSSMYWTSQGFFELSFSLYKKNKH